MSSTSAPEPTVPEHLDQDEVLRVIDFMADCDPIIVGGQSINLWVDFFAGRDQDLDAMGPFTSKDVDFYRNQRATELLADQLVDSKVYLPGSSDLNGANAAIVVGNLGQRRIVVDFMAAVLGVDDDSILDNYVAVEGQAPGTNRVVRLCLMHPLDCVKSRLANINILKRYDDHSVRQAVASIRVLGLFIDDLLAGGLTKAAQKALHALPYVIKDRHLGRASHLRFGERLDMFPLLDRYADDERLDPRWREMYFKRSIERERDRIARYEERMAAKAARAASANSNEPADDDADDDALNLGLSL